ncbi:MULTISPECIES: amino acid adenylation domain-containing protein [unclassified Herbaspirillum]|uniref:non-ribosomal peptide synthetase n=1 Tax=unclassified Herbaspirillum TaxID=2624150 RepID=UPI00114F1404|nr:MULTISPECIES: amino acid adenylation domain-containing protein [unclassified Herbaspirillum]MBB5393965.1 amino acid adenylation domain-containing protein [Herbaspirillum sp. SJZ102]TQK04022.1 amino acid adenylation domain-containing protein [Herbaspirillum sp. SJZ106]TQK14576.1 amino acid adenylation domain-containing protein [Herbaspirillum sp. SJZ130]
MMPLDQTVALSSEQRLQQAQPHIVHTLQLHWQGPLERARLQAAWATVVARHAILRHAFGQVEGYRGLRQAPLPQPPARSLQLQMLPAGAAMPAVQFDLARGQVIQAWLAQDEPQRGRLLAAAAPLVVDERSLSLLADEVWRQYHDPGAPTEEAFPYADYVQWRQSLDEDDDARIGQAYWANQAQQLGQTPALRLSYRRECASGAAEPALLHSRIAEDVVTSLQQWQATRQLQPAIVLQAAWLALLARLGQIGQVACAWQHDCRDDYEPMAQALGLYGKTLPLVLSVPPHASLSELANQLAAQQEQHVAAQEYLPDELAATLPEIGFSARHTVGCWQDGALQWELHAAVAGDARLALALHADLADPAAPCLQLHYDARRYDAASMAGLLRQYQAWLAEALAQPDTACAQLQWDDAAAWPQRLPMQADTLALGHDSLLTHIAAHAVNTPQAIALSSAAGQISYAQLLQRVNQLAHWLHSQGVTRGARVALVLPRSPELVLALLAVWRCGAAYVPIDPDWPAARQQAVLTDAAPALVLHDGKATAAAGLRHALWPADLQGYPAQAPAVEPALQDLAYLLYTSGSTGTPKGVLIEHAQLLNYVVAASQGMALAQCRCWGLTSTVAADLGNTALFAALFHGAELAIADASDMQDGAHFSAFLQRHRVDALKIVPSHLEALLDGGSAVLPATLVLGGETTPAALLRRIWQCRPQARIFNHYGPTETTVGVMWHAFCASDAATDAAAAPLTRVMANCRVAILDADLRPVPVGGTGQLCIAGAQRSRGYLNRPQEDRQGWYRSGDLACYLPQGGLRILGRADEQVKIRGFRIEPAEIEAALLQQAGVRQACVMPQGEPARLIAWVAGADLAVERLRLALQDLLPEAMQPARIVALPSFPRLANGKIDRRALLAALAEPPAEGGQGSQAEAARDDLEFVVLDTMQQLLPATAGLGRDSDFIEAGGHSLLAIKLVARLRKLLQIEIAPALVFDHATPAALAAALRAQAPDASALAHLAGLRRTLLEMPAAQRDALLEQA